MESYTIIIKTGNCSGAGTDAKVYIQLKGELGETDESGFLLGANTTFLSGLLEGVKIMGYGGVPYIIKGDDYFEQGQTNAFQIKVDKNLGDIEKVKIWHDDTGLGSGWYLDWVEVHCQENKWKFPAGYWLAKDMGDRKIERELTVEGGIFDVHIQKEKVEYITTKQSTVFDNLNNSSGCLEKTFDFSVSYKTETQNEVTKSQEKSNETKFSISSVIKGIELGLEASNSIANKLESKYGKTISSKTQASENIPIKVNPNTLLIVSANSVQDKISGTIVRGSRTLPFEMLSGKPKINYVYYSYKKGDPSPTGDSKKEMEEILQSQNRPIPWK
ncbi:hypothetical protein NG791_22895 [Laspinema sp. D1]|uniref:PLAT/LH2 domain-containing protein n=1 Tax=Laspinema palackyanum TaxID=3231601 RepID=UPI00348C1DD3|nr:hypothetical protein [Laspinema sp. D2b]